MRSARDRLDRAIPERSRRLARTVVLVALCATLSGAAVTASSPVAVIKMPLAVVVHKSFGSDDITSSMLRKVLASELPEWPDSRKVVLVQLPPESPVYQQMLREVLHTDLKGYRRHLLQVEFQGKEMPLIKTLSSDEMVMKFVGNVPGAIAVVDGATFAANSRTKLLRVDGKLPGEKGYPLQ